MLIICLFLAAAQPVNRKVLHHSTESYCVLILDDSASMNAFSKAPWNNLLKASEKIVASFSKKTHIAVIFTGGRIIPFSIDPLYILKEIRETNPGFHGNSMEFAIQQACTMLEKKSGYKRIFIITDMQKPGWENVKPLMEKINDIVIVDAGYPSEQLNLSIKEIQYLPGKNMAYCQLTNWSQQPISLEVKITTDLSEQCLPARPKNLK